MATGKTTNATAEELLVQFFDRNGCFRKPDQKRRKKESRTYKMGYEIRLVAKTKKELAKLRQLTRRVGLKPGKPYAKANQWTQPVYGAAAMALFAKWYDEYGTGENPFHDDPESA